MNGKVEWCFADIERIEARINELNYTDSAISKLIGRSRGWLWSVKNRIHNSSIPFKIRANDAEKLAETLGCTLQDLGVTPFFNPVIIDYKTKARENFNFLLEKHAKQIADVLDFIKGASPTELKDLEVFVGRKLSGTAPKGKRPALGPQWWKGLYLELLFDEILQQITFCDDRELKNRIVQTLGRKGSGNNYEEVKNVIVAATRKERAMIEEFFVGDFKKETSPIDNVNNKFASFLWQYFWGAGTNPTINSLIEQYRDGRVDGENIKGESK